MGGDSPAAFAGPAEANRYSDPGRALTLTVDGFLAHFQFEEDVDRVVLDLSRAHVWDHSAVAGTDKAVLRFRRRVVEVELEGMNEASATLISRLAVHDKPGAQEMAPGH
jgi:SulP family sulfate permease